MDEPQKHPKSTAPDSGYVTGRDAHSIYWQLCIALTLLVMTFYVWLVGEKWSFIEYLWAGILVGIGCMVCFFVLWLSAITLHWIFTAVFFALDYVFRRIHMLIFPSWYKKSK